MKAVKLREHTDDELQQLYQDTRKELFDLRVRKGTGDSSEQPLRIRVLRRDIARIETVLGERLSRGQIIKE